MDGVVSPALPQKQTSAGAQPLVIAGCTAPEILKLIAAINSRAERSYEVVGFLDIDKQRIKEGFRGFPVWDEGAISRDALADAAVVVNVAGSMTLRWAVAERLRELGFLDMPAMIHPNVDLFGASVGDGTTIYHGVQVGMDVTIGELCLLLMGALVNHEARIGSCTFLGPGSIVLGRAVLGDRVYLGAGAVVFPGVVVGEDATVGAGAVVRENVPDGAVVAGVPARVLKPGDQHVHPGIGGNLDEV